MKKNIYHIEPVLQETLWGSDELIKKYKLKTDLKNVGQIYHVIALPDHLECTVTETGEGLAAFYKNHPELFNCSYKDFPIRLATLTVKGKMSYQLHPTDEYAMKHEGTRGKVSGLVSPTESDVSHETLFGNTAKTLDEFKDMVERKDWNKLFTVVQHKEGDFLHTPAGVIHGHKGDGEVLVVFATNSDITYRFYDYDRNDPKRPLHLQQVYDCVNIPEVEIGTIHAEPEEMNGLVVYNYYSQPNEYVAKKLVVREKGSFEMEQFMFLMCESGQGEVDGVDIGLGETLFIPANYGRIQLQGNMNLYMISCLD